MNKMCTIVIGFLVLIEAIGTATAQDFIFPAQPMDFRIRLNVQVNDRHPEAHWEDFMDRWLEFFDRNRDGGLNREEASRVIPLPLPEQRQVTLDFGKVDANGDGNCSKSEFKEYYRNAGFTPLIVTIEDPSKEVIRNSELLFRYLDLDSDFTLTNSELKQAPDLMARFDEDEDELLTATELSTGPIPADFTTSIQISGTEELVLAGKTETPKVAFNHTESAVAALADASVTIRMSQADSLPSILFDKRTDTPIDVKEVDKQSPTLPLRLQFGNSFCAVAVADEEKHKSFQIARRFYVAQFRTGFGNQSDVTLKQLSEERTLKRLVELFDPADRDANGQLSLPELTELLSLIELGIGCQVRVLLRCHGRNLVELLDTDHDQQLSPLELQAAEETVRHVMPQAQTPAVAESFAIRAKDIPLRYSLHCERGTAGSTFGPVSIPMRTSVRNTPKQQTELPGPAWFVKLDRNANGLLSLAEFPGRPELFDRFDSNHDGLICLDEALALRPLK